MITREIKLVMVKCFYFGTGAGIPTVEAHMGPSYTFRLEDIIENTKSFFFRYAYLQRLILEKYASYILCFRVFS